MSLEQLKEIEKTRRRFPGFMDPVVVEQGIILPTRRKPSPKPARKKGGQV
jgi:hypothetical protein